MLGGSQVEHYHALLDERPDCPSGWHGPWRDGQCVDCPAPDPYAKVVFVRGHRHSEPVCAWPDCQTYLTREQMSELPDA